MHICTYVYIYVCMHCAVLLKKILKSFWVNMFFFQTWKNFLDEKFISFQKFSLKNSFMETLALCLCFLPQQAVLAKVKRRNCEIRG